jgi:hypothetical protein
VRPPTLTEFLDILRKVTPREYHDPFFDDPGGAISLYRQFARQTAYLAKRINRAASRQYFRAPQGEEPAGFATHATMTATLTRSQFLDQLLVVDAGSLFIDGPRELRYISTETVTWYPGDPEQDKAIPLRAEYVGEPWNLEWLGYGDALQVVQPETVTRDGETVDLSEAVVDTRALGLANQSDQRSGVGATLDTTPDLAELTDSGLAPVFRPDDVGLHLRINNASNGANVGRVLRIVGYSRSVIDSPAGSGIFPRTVILDDGLEPALLASAQLDDGGAFTDYTAASQTQSIPDDLELLPAAPVVNDAFYFGAGVPFGSLTLEVSTRLIGTLTLAWEYWDGATFVPIPGVTDGTAGFTLTGAGTVSFAIPGGWASTTINGVAAFYVRARVSAFTSIGQQPLGQFAAFAVEQPLAPEPNPGEISWTVLDWIDIGVTITSQTAPQGGRDADLELLVRERGVVQRDGETEAQLRRRAQRLPDVVTPRAIENEVNRILEPAGLAGKVCDPSNGGFLGLFWDIPASFAPEIVAAWDMYAPGDAFPENKSFLPLNYAESHFCFWVKVPPSGLGEFGAAWDVGPPSFYSQQFGTFLGSAWDYAFPDGYPWLTSKLLMGVHQIVSQIKAGGTCFHIVEGDVPVCS